MTSFQVFPIELTNLAGAQQAIAARTPAAANLKIALSYGSFTRTRSSRVRIVKPVPIKSGRKRMAQHFAFLARSACRAIEPQPFASDGVTSELFRRSGPV
jgi:hypothetical protein